MNCALCKGNLKKGMVNHIIDLGDGIIIIKDVPANVCNQYGEYYVDTETAIKLEEIVEKSRKNNVPRYVLVEYSQMQEETVKDEEIDEVAKRLLSKHFKAFEELGK